MKRLSTGWRVDIQDLPEILRNDVSLIEIDHYENLLRAHARALAFEEGKIMGYVGEELSEYANWLLYSTDKAPEHFRFRIAREQEEGQHGHELEDARLMRIRDEKKKRRRNVRESRQVD